MSENTADSIIGAVTKWALPIFSILTLVTGTMLFWPSGVELFRLNRIPNWISDYAGLAFIISAAVLAFIAVRFVITRLSESKAEAEYLRTLERHLWSLTVPEKAVLREFILSGADVVELPFQDPAVLSLKNKRIIFYAASSGVVKDWQMLFPFQIPYKIKEMLVAHQDKMLDAGRVMRLYNTDRAAFEASRPHFRQSNGYY